MISQKNEKSNSGINIAQYRSDYNNFVSRYEATEEEYSEVNKMLNVRSDGDNTLQRLLQEDMFYIFGQGTRIFENGKFSPQNERVFGKYSPQGFLHAHGYDLMKMLLLAKRGKVPPYSAVGSLNHSFQLGFPEEIRFLQRVEQTLHQHGVPVQYVLKDDYNYFELRRDIRPGDRKAW